MTTTRRRRTGRLIPTSTSTLVREADEELGLSELHRSDISGDLANGARLVALAETPGTAQALARLVASQWNATTAVGLTDTAALLAGAQALDVLRMLLDLDLEETASTLRNLVRLVDGAVEHREGQLYSGDEFDALVLSEIHRAQRLIRDNDENLERLLGAARAVYAGDARVTVEASHRLAEHWRAEAERLGAWLEAIDGGDHPIEDASKLRQMAFEAVTLGRTYGEGGTSQ